MSSARETSLDLALGVPELRDVICRAPTLTKRDLKHLCLVSRGWRAVASPALWESLGDLGILCLSIPETALEELRQNAVHPDILLPQEQQPDWGPFNKVSILVKYIRTNFDMCQEDQLWIARYPPGDSLFPRLRHLDINVQGNTQLQAELLRLLLSPTVTELTLLLPSWQPIHWPLISSSAPNLARVTLEISFRDIEAESVVKECRALIAILTGLPLLKSVSLCLHIPFIPSILPILSTCPALEELELAYMDHSNSSGHVPPLPCLGFASLRVLRGMPAPLHVLRAIVTAGGVCPLQSIVAGLPADKELRGFFHDLANHCLHGTLTSLSLHAIPMLWLENPAHAPTTLDRDALAPLANFPNLSFISIHTSMPISLTDADCEEMASWWPALQRLHLQSHHSSSLIPLSALSHFAHHCPHLLLLAIPIDATVVPEVALDHPALARGWVGSEGSALCIRADGAPIEDAQAVARFLAATFPALREVGIPTPLPSWLAQGTLDDADHRQAALWWQVNLLLDKQYGRFDTHARG